MNIHSGLNSKPSFKFKTTYPQYPTSQLLNSKTISGSAGTLNSIILFLNLFIQNFYLTLIIKNIQIINHQNPSSIFLNSKL